MFTSGRSYRYQEPNATMTLREGLAEYKTAHPELLDPASFENPKVGELFACHDPCHIVFGTNTDIIQEGMTDFWTMWGSSIGWRAYAAYLKEPGAMKVLKDIMKQFTWWQIARDQLRSLPYYWRVWRHSKRMSKRWDFYAWRDYLDTPLDQIRREHGIELIDPPDIRVPAAAIPRA
jgi:hypothetical protein